MRVILRCVLVAIVASSCNPVKESPTAPTRTASRLTIAAFPSSVLMSGSTSTLTVRALDVNGAGMPGVLVGFGTTGGTGTITPRSLTTNGSGEAQATLSASGPVTIGVAATGLPDAFVTVGGLAPFAIRATGDSPVYTDTWNANVGIEMTAAALTPPMPATVTLFCGGATTTRSGFTGSWPVPCVFGSTGTHTVTATATAANGWSTAGSMTVTAIARPTPSPTPVPSPPTTPAPTPRLTIRAFELKKTQTSAMWRFEPGAEWGEIDGQVAWNFGSDASPASTTTDAAYVDVTYSERGTRQVRAVATIGDKERTATQLIVVAFCASGTSC